MTRDSVLTLAREQGFSVDERDLSAQELIDRVQHPDCEAALSGTAAVLASVGTLIFHGTQYRVGCGEPGPNVMKLKKALNEIQWGIAEDKHNWMLQV